MTPLLSSAVAEPKAQTISIMVRHRAIDSTFFMIMIAPPKFFKMNETTLVEIIIATSNDLVKQYFGIDS